MKLELEPRRDLRRLIDCFTKHDLLTYASAIGFQLLVALIPLTALTLLLVGLARAGDLWYEHVQPAVADRVTPEVFLAVSDAVDRVLNQTSYLWIGLAIALTIWEVSGSVRAVMGALNRVYGAREQRSIYRRFGISLLLAVAVIVLVLTALGLVAIGGWKYLPVAFVLLWATIALLLRFAPADHVEFTWISFGSVLVILSWLGASLFYGFYVRNLANFESAFGFVAAGMLLTGYLYWSSIVFLVGAQIDQIAREDAKGGTGSGRSRRGSRSRKGRRPRRRSKGSSDRARAA
jgi:membrane protein